MILQKIIKELPTAISVSFNGANRLRQTATAIGVTGLDWFLGGQPPTEVYLRKAFERMGATYIKIGQLIASSPSLFPEAYVQEFQKCLDQTEPVPFRHMKRILEQDLGPDFNTRIFSEINPVPLASASIAQVYSARLTSGEDVVIKIQRPGVKYILTTDLNVLLLGSKILETVMPSLKHASLSGILYEIRRTVMEECNFIKEAENINIFRKFLEKTGNQQVITPRVYPEASTERVLTMERLYGIPLTDKKQFLESTEHPYQVLGAAFETWMDSITGCEIFHADLHAGNILILNDGRVGFIDFGIVGSISEKTQKGVISLMNAMMVMDFPLMAESMLNIGMTKTKVDTVQLAKDLEAFHRANESLESVELNGDIADFTEPDQILLEIVRIAEVHGIRFPREFTLLLKQFLYFDSYRDILFDMEEFMEEMMTKIEGSGYNFDWLE
jgi:predicted unusual protein kinase regulating ubiquinone biosynthesis (AarF/ABC1/UbiB family)